MDISVIIPAYNSEKLLEKNLPKVLDALEKYKKGNTEIIISDDASEDNSVQIAKKFITSLKAVHVRAIVVENKNKKNRGFSKNVNRGMQRASGEIVVLLNTDVAPYKEFLVSLLTHFADPKTFAVGCLDESIENGKAILRGRGIGKWVKGFLMHSAGSLDKSNTLWVSGGSGAFRKSIWIELGGLNELFNPFYWEDIDLSYRAQKAGYKIFFEKKSRVIHEHSKGAIQTNFKSYIIQKIAYRNQFTFVWINITDKKLLVSHIMWLPYHFIHAIRSQNKALLVGFFDALIRLPRILVYKRKIKKQFIISDQEILQPFSEEK